MTHRHSSTSCHSLFFIIYPRQSLSQLYTKSNIFRVQFAWMSDNIRFRLLNISTIPRMQVSVYLILLWNGTYPEFPKAIVCGGDYIFQKPFLACSY